MIIRFLRDNWTELGPKGRSVVAGLAAGVSLVIGQALLSVAGSGVLPDLSSVGRSLLMAEAGAVANLLLARQAV